MEFGKVETVFWHTSVFYYKITIMTEVAQRSTIDLYSPASGRLPDMFYGGLRQAVEQRAPDETPQQFCQRLYGESYEYRDVIERLWSHFHELKMYRQEEWIDNIPHLEPEIRIGHDGQMFVDKAHAIAAMSEPDTASGKTTLFYKDWLVLGAEPKLEAVAIGDEDKLGRRKVRFRVTPKVDDDQPGIIVMANPLLYVPTPEEVKEFQRLMPKVLEDSTCQLAVNRR